MHCRGVTGDARDQVLVDGLSGEPDPATDRKGKLHVLDSGLSARTNLYLLPLREENSSAKLEAVEDLDGDKRPELLLVAGEGKVVSLTNLGNKTAPANRVDSYGRQLLVLDTQLNVRGRLRVR